MECQLASCERHSLVSTYFTNYTPFVGTHHVPWTPKPNIITSCGKFKSAQRLSPSPVVEEWPPLEVSRKPIRRNRFREVPLTTNWQGASFASTGTKGRLTRQGPPGRVIAAHAVHPSARRRRCRAEKQPSHRCRVAPPRRTHQQLTQGVCSARDIAPHQISVAAL